MIEAQIGLSSEQQHLPSSASRTEGVNWYALQTIPRHEKALTTQLEVDGVTCFLPLTRQSHKWTDRTKAIDVPLFPGYVFVRLGPDRDQRVHVLRKAGVVRFVGTAQRAIPVADDEIESVRRLLERKITCQPHSFLKVGQRVRIRSGALQGLEGILLNVAEGDRLVLSIDLIQRSLSIRIEGYELDAI